jgi:hypothetical protein
MPGVSGEADLPVARRRALEDLLMGNGDNDSVESPAAERQPVPTGDYLIERSIA